MDRNGVRPAACPPCNWVAPLAGSVDRNLVRLHPAPGKAVAPLAGSVDRNWPEMLPPGLCGTSLPSRGAWIEIPVLSNSASVMPCVAPLAGSVDRNGPVGGRAQGRNPVAPLAGSVDRNAACALPQTVIYWSLPSRGAWIEIWRRRPPPWRAGSLPSRGAWIEISCCQSVARRRRVAPLAGSVDRNYIVSR